MLALEGGTADVSIPRSGCICEGRIVRFCWPSLDEIEAIAALLSMPEVRRWSIDSRLADAGAIWAMNRFGAPHCAVLAIRSKSEERLLGTFGWSDWNPAEKSVWLGMLAIDRAALRTVVARNRAELVSPGLDAALTLRDYVFEKLDLKSMFTYFLAGNARSERLHRTAGMIEVDRLPRTRPDGAPIELVINRLTREAWRTLPRQAVWMA
jgi:RimJ/RimL family protein N-acetyltransferase